MLPHVAARQYMYMYRRTVSIADMGAVAGWIVCRFRPRRSVHALQAGKTAARSVVPTYEKDMGRATFVRLSGRNAASCAGNNCGVQNAFQPFGVAVLYLAKAHSPGESTADQVEVCSRPSMHISLGCNYAYKTSYANRRNLQNAFRHLKH